ncbi:MAG: hypothetical protein ABI664_15155 [bacterium]
MDVHKASPARSLGQATPASRYRVSPRPYSDRLPTQRVPGPLPREEDHDRRDVSISAPLDYLANAMIDQHIGLEETDNGIWAIHLNTVLLATFNERDYIITG